MGGGGPGGATGADVSVNQAEIPAGYEWFCSVRCGRSLSSCDRRSQAQLPGDLTAAHRSLAPPRCTRTAEVHCFTYKFTIAETTPMRQREALGIAGQDRTPRDAHECYPSASACAEARDQRDRRGVFELSACEVFGSS
jgi:hypothetical protein